MKFHFCKTTANHLFSVSNDIFNFPKISKSLYTYIDCSYRKVCVTDKTNFWSYKWTKNRNQRKIRHRYQLQSNRMAQSGVKRDNRVQLDAIRYQIKLIIAHQVATTLYSHYLKKRFSENLNRK